MQWQRDQTVKPTLALVPTNPIFAILILPVIKLAFWPSLLCLCMFLIRY